MPGGASRDRVTPHAGGVHAARSPGRTRALVIISGVFAGCAFSRAGLAAAAVVLLAGCGSSPAAPGLPANVAAALRTDLDKVQTAAAAHDAVAAGNALSAFATEVARQQSAGHLGPADYRALQTGIARARTRVSAEVTAPAPVAPQPVAPAPGNGNGAGDGKPENDGGAGKGNGHGKGNGGG